MVAYTFISLVFARWQWSLAISVLIATATGIRHVKMAGVFWRTCNAFVKNSRWNMDEYGGILVWTPWVIFKSSFCLPGGSRALSPTMIAATILRMTMTPRAGGPSVRRQFPKCWDLQRQPASRSEPNCRNLCLMTWWILISWLTLIDYSWWWTKSRDRFWLGWSLVIDMSIFLHGGIIVPFRSI